MEIEKIRELRRAHPFRPFKLVLQSGRQLLVDHPFFLGIEPDGKLIWSSFSGGFQRVNPAKVNQILMVERGPRRSSGGNGNRGSS